MITNNYLYCSAAVREFGRSSEMSLPKAVLGGNFVEWRIYAIESEMRSPTFLMDDAGMVCQVILEAVDKSLKDFKLYIRLLNNTQYQISFSCFINDEHYIKVETEYCQSGKYKSQSNVSAKLPPKHMCDGNPHMTVRLRWFLHNQRPSNMLVLPSTLLEQFNSLLRSGDLSDMAIETEDGSRIPVHRVVLAMRSPVFHAMLMSDMAESRSQCIKICDFPPETVNQMVTFIYSGQLKDVTYESAVSLLKIADKYDLKDLKKLCGKYLLMHLSSSNALELLLFTDKYGEKIVKQQILGFISENRKKFSERDAFDCLQETDRPLFIDIILALAQN